jgi:group II intron reverse transcriptase/maturase
MNYFGLTQAKSITKRLISGTYKFAPVKRTWILKPGKKKKRPVDVPSQSDRIVQEAVRGILEAIYEPVFLEQGILTNHLSNNYGFRPKHSTWTAIQKLERSSRLCNIVIEGDIVSAYNHVDHDILLKILKKRITDKKFLQLIKQMLKCGIMDKKTFEHSLNGTPQGGIVSPLLFNIYLLSFDQFMYKEFIVPILEENKTKNKRELTTSAYNKIRVLTDKARKKLREFKENPDARTDPIELKKLTKEYKRFRNIRNQTPHTAAKRLKKGAVFVRYADDWVLAITCTNSKALEIKERISEFLLKEKKMELDSEKTKITYVQNGYKFLGFEIRLMVENPRQTRVLSRHPNGTYSRSLKRTTSRQFTVEPDTNRILKRLLALKMCRPNGFPLGKTTWRQYDEFQIVQKYNQMFRGIFNYYAPCGRVLRLQRISYILQYSCAKTLAGRKKTSLRKIFKTYGKNLRITEKKLGTRSDYQMSTQFLDLTNLRKINPAKEFQRTNLRLDFQDPFRIKEYWRTKFKVYHECCICGSTDSIALHHNKSLRSQIKKAEGFHNIISQVNRLQIPVCHPCHLEITHGRFNDPKKPIEFYNEFLAKL